MKRWFWIGMLTASCGLFTPKPLAPTMEPYIEKLDPTDFGVIPTDLHGAIGDVNAPAPTASNASNSTSGEPMPQLEYAGLTDKGMCFVYRAMLPPTDDEPADAMVKHFQDQLLGNQAGGMWIQPVAAISDIASQPRWPPPAGGVRITSIEKRGDEAVIQTEKKNMGGGDYVEVKHDYRMVLIELCGDKPAITPATKYLVAGRHLPPLADDLQFETTESGDHEEHNEKVRRQHDAFYVWELSDSGHHHE